MEQLGIPFLNHEVPLKAYATREGVENWLRELKRLNGKSASPGTKSKIRNVMSAMFSHAMRYSWATQNPIKAVPTSSQRLSDPDLLTPKEFQDLLRELDDYERAVVPPIGSTALRKGVLFGLRWENADLEDQLIRDTHSVYRSVECATKNGCIAQTGGLSN